MRVVVEDEWKGTLRHTMITVSVVLFVLFISSGYADTLRGRAENDIISPKSFAVLPNDFTYRTDSFAQHFKPANSTQAPTFQIFNEAFLDIIGSSPSISEIASNSSYAFAHEGPIYISETEEVFFASNAGGALGMSDINHNNAFFKLSLSEAEEMLGSGGNNKAVNVPITQIRLSDSIQMTSGGTGPFNGNLVLSNSGRGPLPPTLALVNSKPPYNSTILLNNFYGRQYNSLNDVKVHPTSGNLFFSDTTYGSIQQFRDKPTLPSQVYRFDMNTGAVQVVANNFDQANGIAFTGDGKTIYIGDSGAAGGTPTQPSTIYVFDVDEKTQALSNRRVLAYVDAGAPDGIQVDEKGNVYVACADGVQVFAPDGMLLGKFFLDISSANMVFAGPGRMVILAETKVFLAKISENTKGVVS